jgi:putative two-component system response regulator
MMPEIDGYQVLQQLRSQASTRDIPVIFVTAMDADEDEERGLSLGAVDYVTKPIKPGLLLARVRAHLELKSARDGLSRQNAELDAEVHRRMAENDLIKDFSLNALATLAEKRDNETGNHLRRTQAYIEALMERLQNHPRFSAELADPQARQRIAKAAPLHDIGKVGIPDAILLKPGKLTAQEFEIMKTHASIGAQAIGDAIRSVQAARLQSDNANDAAQTAQSLGFLETTRQIAGSHHEKWDGSGYPDGIAGEAIPLAARLMAIADVFDALMSKRHYKEAFPLAQTADIILQGSGHHFDPDIADSFLALQDTFADIASRFADAPPASNEH